MAMPKKGSRKIVVDGKEYKYVVKPIIYGGTSYNGGKVTVQLREPSKKHADVPVDGYYAHVLFEDAITPAIVEHFIRKTLAETAVRFN